MKKACGLIAHCLLSLFAFALSAADKKQTVVKFWASVNDADENDYRAKWNARRPSSSSRRQIRISRSNSPTRPNGDQYLSKITTEMASGSVPDVFQAWTAGRLEPFVKAGTSSSLWISGSRRTPALFEESRSPRATCPRPLASTGRSMPCRTNSPVNSSS